MNVKRVACTVLEENVDRIVALDGCWVSAVVQILNTCPLFCACRHELFEQRVNLNYLETLVAAEWVDVAIVYKFEDVVLRIGRCCKTSLYLRFA